jgi:peptide/nickel transport system substrate-binding protein
VRVRRAIAHAIDRRALVRAKFGGRARLARGWIPPDHWAYWRKTPFYEHDLGRARELLDRAGVRQGNDERPRIELTLRTSSDRFRQSIAKAIAEMLRQAGIEVDIRPTEVAMLLADLNRGHFELSLLQVPEVIEPHVLSWFFASDRIPRKERAEGANRWRFSSAALDAALEDGRRTPYLPRRKQAYRRVQRILAEQVPVVPLWHEDNVAVVSRKASAFRVPVDGRFTPLAVP